MRRNNSSHPSEATQGVPPFRLTARFTGSFSSDIQTSVSDTVLHVKALNYASHQNCRAITTNAVQRPRCRVWVLRWPQTSSVFIPLGPARFRDNTSSVAVAETLVLRRRWAGLGVCGSSPASYGVALTICAQCWAAHAHTGHRLVAPNGN